VIHSCATCLYYEPLYPRLEIKNRCALLDIYNLEDVEQDNDCEYHELAPAGGDGVALMPLAPDN
jgi:hypothetical protein